VGVIPATISGFVRDSAGNPIPQAVVQAAAKTTLTDNQGAYTLKEVPAGEITALASKTGYSTGQQTVNVSSGETLSLNFTLTIAATGTISGKITDNEDNAVEGAAVSISGPTLASTISNVNGNYDITLLPLGTYNIRASKTGYIDANTTTTLTASQPAKTVNLKLNPIPKATLKGVVQDSLRNPVAFAKIFVDGKVLAFSKPVTGEYSVELPAEPTGTSYSVYATKAGYTPSEIADVVLTQSEIEQLDFALATVLCAYPESRPVPKLTAEHIKGVRGVKLSWQLPGACNNLAGYILIRERYTGSNLESAQQAAFLAVTETNHPVGYTDYNVLWSNTYQYKIMAVYSDNIFRNSTATSSDKITLGNASCEGKYHEGFGRFVEFCIDQYKRKTCDNENKVINAPSAFGNPPDCSDRGPTYFCSGPDFLGYTECRDSGECDPVLQGAAPFGFYFSEDTCLGTNNENYCYYDYSNTIVDVCLPCSQEMTCFNYRSKDACLTDNCVAAENSSCKWVNTFYAGFGKGICYQENYNKSDYCYKCSAAHTLFENYECTQELCSKLGQCYADETNSNCMACAAETKCEDLTTEAQCEGGQPIQILNCGETIIPSNDVCKLGTCKWDDAAGLCYKDANDDDYPECFDSANPELCKKDNKAPATKTEKQFYLASQGTEINLLTDQDAEFFFYCIDHDNECCPTNFKYVYNGTVSLVPSELPEFVELYGSYGSISPYYLRFYSVDGNFNQEKLRNISFYIDMAPPAILISYNVTARTGVTPVASDLVLEITLDEVGKCSDALTYIPTGATQSKLQEESGDFFILNYTSLQDGLYLYNISCEDSFGNKMSKIIEPLIVDAFRYIDVVFPEGPIKQTSISFQIKTQDRAVCDLYKQGEYFDEFTTTDYLTHTSSQHTLATNTYYPYFVARCTDLSEPDIVDSAPIIFTIDQLPPVTIANITNSIDYLFDKTEWRAGLKGDVLILLSCSDALQGGFGCNLTDILYCVAPNITASCTPTSPLARITPKNNTRICYFSTDKGGNKETVKCGTVIIGEFFGIRLIQPPYNVSSTPVFDVEIELDRATESCKFAASDFVFSELVSPANQFTKLSSTRFIYRNFSFTTPYPMNIKCKDMQGKINDEPVVYSLEYDPTAPVITRAYADPASVIQGSKTTINVITDDKTICKFDKAQQLYEYMQGKFEGWDEKKFSNIHTHTIFLTAADDQKTHNYSVSCESRAGNISSAKKIQFNVDFSAAGSIVKTLPDKAGRETTVNLTIVTNKNAVCEYQDDAVWKNFASTGGTTHINLKTGLSEGQYSFPVRCRFIQSNDIRAAVIKFSVDQTPPIMTNIEDYNYTCGNVIQPTFEANDTSPISYYNYSLYDLATGDLIVDWTTTTSNNPQLEDLNITIGEQYYFKAIAVDQAGNIGIEAQSDGFIVEDSSSLICEDDSVPPLVTISTSIVSTGIKVTLTCSDQTGCLSKFYSTSIPPAGCFVGNQSYTEPVVLQQTSYFCYEVYDASGNLATGSQLITLGDSDLDGVPDNLDQCPGTPTGATTDEAGCSAEQKDSDNDGMPDYWEIRYDLNPNDPADRDDDPDNDGYTNYEEYVQGTDPTVADIFDSDDDGVPDNLDQCPYTPEGEFVDSEGCSDSQKDSDNDGMDDAWEKRAGLDPFDPSDADIDSDGDGMLNSEEYNYYKDTDRFIDPFEKDTDGDGWTDKEEIDMGFNPADIYSHPEKTKLFPLILLILGLLLMAGGGGYTIYNQFIAKKPAAKPKPMIKPAFKEEAPLRPSAPPKPAPLKPMPPPKPLISAEEMRRRAMEERLRKAKERKSKRRERYFEVFGAGRAPTAEKEKPKEKPRAPKPEVTKPEVREAAAPKAPIPKTRTEFETLAKITEKQLEKKKELIKEKKPEFEKLSRLLEKRIPAKPAKKPLTAGEKKTAKDIFASLEKISTKKEKERIMSELTKPAVKPSRESFEKLSKLKTRKRK
jgi:hypothetical protein